MSTAVAAETPTPVTVDFVAPAGCSSLDSFYRGVRSRTDRVRLANPGEQGVRISVRVFRVGMNIRGELRIGDNQEESETRRVDGISCNEVVEALSLTAALALDPRASLLSGSDTKSIEASVPTPAQPESPRNVLPPRNGSTGFVAPSAETPKRAFIKGVDVHVQALAATYMTPGVMLGPQVGARLLMPAGRFSQTAAGLQGFFLSNEVAGSAGAGVFSIAGFGFTLCPLYGSIDSRLEFGACAIGRGGWLKASAVGVAHSTSVKRSWWTMGAEALAVLKVWGPWHVELSAGLALPLVIREFNTGTSEQAREVGKTPIVSAHTGLGIVFRF